MAPKKSLKKIVTPDMEAYKELIDSQADTINPMPLHPTNGQDEYSLGPIYKTTNNSIAFLFDRSTYLLFIKKSEANLSMWLESKKPLITWSMVKSEFITWIDKV